MSFTMPDVAATRAKMLAAYRDGLRDVLEESTRTVAELRTAADEAAGLAVAAGATIEEAIDSVDNVPVITRRDVDQALDAIFGQPVPMPDETWAEVHTPATIVTSAVCPRCGMAQRILVNLHAELLIGEDGSELRVKPKTKGVAHICGQLPLPVEEVADGQQELPLDAEAEAEEEVKLLEAGETPNAEAEAEPDVLYALVKDGETLDEALARIEKLDDYARVIGSDAGQRLLEELNRQRDIRRRSADAPALGVGDAVVDDGVKYRVREITEIGQTAMAQLAAAGPSWKRTPIVRNADVHQLEWDRVAAVWRGPTWEAEA